jgi:hypothetical protein
MNKKKVSLDKIKFDDIKKEYNFFDFPAMEERYWKTEFNNRSFELVLSYIFMMNYYQTGIPDDEWHISPGKSGNTVDYFPHFKRETFYLSILVWVLYG